MYAFGNFKIVSIFQSINVIIFSIAGLEFQYYLGEGRVRVVLHFCSFSGRGRLNGIFIVSISFISDEIKTHSSS